MGATSWQDGAPLGLGGEWLMLLQQGRGFSGQAWAGVGKGSAAMMLRGLGDSDMGLVFLQGSKNLIQLFNDSCVEYLNGYNHRFSTSQIIC